MPFDAQKMVDELSKWATARIEVHRLAGRESAKKIADKTYTGTDLLADVAKGFSRVSEDMTTLIATMNDNSPTP